MNAWVCDGCGAIRRDHPLGWLNVREVIEKTEPRNALDFWNTIYSNERMFCSTDCIAATYVLRGIEEQNRG